MDFTCLLRWYAENARDLPWRNTRDPYAIWISEVMLQQTRVQAVLGYYPRFLSAFPDPTALASATEQRLMKQWEGLGYYRRAQNLKRAAERIVADHGGRLPASYEALLALPGFGAYTAGAVASIAFGLPVPAVDGNVLRVYARLTGARDNVQSPAFHRACRSALAPALALFDPGTFNQALMELGATRCLPNGAPDCAACPLRPQCAAYACDTVREIPQRGAKRPRRIETKTVFALYSDAGVYAFLRPDTGLLASLWQLPEAEGQLDAAGAARQIGQWGLLPQGALRAYDRTHLFTHVEWHMRVYAARVSGTPAKPLTPLPDGAPLPAAYRICLR